jgi:hypothetical protein
MYSADNVYIIGKQQEKDGTDLAGYNFIINVEKSRFVREKAKIPITVKFEGGMSRYSGLLDMALESGLVKKVSGSWYSRVMQNGELEEKKWRAKNTDTSEFWDEMLKNQLFLDWIKTNYKISNSKIMQHNENVEMLDDDEEL